MLKTIREKLANYIVGLYWSRFEKQYIESIEYNWWRGWAAMYGLPTDGTAEQLKARIIKSCNPPSDE